MKVPQIRLAKPVAAHRLRDPGSFCRALIAPESLAARESESAYLVGTVLAGLSSWIQPVRYHPPWQKPMRLRPPRPDLRDSASEPRPRIDGILPACRKRLVRELDLLATLRQFLCCQPVWLTPRSAG